MWGDSTVAQCTPWGKTNLYKLWGVEIVALCHSPRYGLLYLPWFLHSWCKQHIKYRNKPVMSNIQCVSPRLFAVTLIVDLECCYPNELRYFGPALSPRSWIGMLRKHPFFYLMFTPSHPHLLKPNLGLSKLISFPGGLGLRWVSPTSPLTQEVTQRMSNCLNCWWNLMFYNFDHIHTQ